MNDNMMALAMALANQQGQQGLQRPQSWNQPNWIGLGQALGGLYNQFGPQSGGTGIPSAVRPPAASITPNFQSGVY